jgi:hypothetical protein
VAHLVCREVRVRRRDERDSVDLDGASAPLHDLEVPDGELPLAAQLELDEVLVVKVPDDVALELVVDLPDGDLVCSCALPLPDPSELLRPPAQLREALRRAARRQQAVIGQAMSQDQEGIGRLGHTPPEQRVEDVDGEQFRARRERRRIALIRRAQSLDRPQCLLHWTNIPNRGSNHGCSADLSGLACSGPLRG